MSPARRIEIAAGETFGRWTVLHEDTHAHGRAWRCQCECGAERVVLQARLRQGKSRSCGCRAIDMTRARSIGQTYSKKHGMFGTRIHSTWANMLSRCRNPHDKEYKRYGGRGIKVCERWRDFSAFYEDMGDAPKGFQLDRIDNNGDYCKENCRWASSKTQNNNRRDNFMITLGGETKTLAQWSEITGIHRMTIKSRILRGWSPARALVASPEEYTSGRERRLAVMGATNQALGRDRQTFGTGAVQ